MTKRAYHRGYDEEAAKVSMGLPPLSWGRRVMLMGVFLAAVAVGMLVGSLV